MRRPLRGYDWETRSCGLHGHLTFAPDEPELAKALSARTSEGQTWRCLRCGVFVLGAPGACGPADAAPTPLRGRTLRDAFILRLLAAERLIRAAALIVLGYGLWRFEGSRDSLQRTVDSWLPTLRPVADRIGVDLAESGPVRLLERAFAARQSTLTLLTVGVFLYAGLQIVEGVGLALLRRWGEYVAVIGTSVFLPLEIDQLTERVTVLRMAALLINVFAVGYLLWTKRLFGIRGGRAAYEQQRTNQSLIEVVAAAATAGLTRS